MDPRVKPVKPEDDEERLAGQRPSALPGEIGRHVGFRQTPTLQSRFLTDWIVLCDHPNKKTPRFDPRRLL